MKIKLLSYIHVVGEASDTTSWEEYEGVINTDQICYIRQFVLNRRNVIQPRDVAIKLVELCIADREIYVQGSLDEVCLRLGIEASVG